MSIFNSSTHLSHFSVTPLAGFCLGEEVCELVECCLRVNRTYATQSGSECRKVTASSTRERFDVVKSQYSIEKGSTHYAADCCYTKARNGVYNGYKTRK